MAGERQAGDILDGDDICDNAQAPEGYISVCQYMKVLWDTCLPLYSRSGCRSGEEVIRLEEMWMKQAVSETEVYGPQGDILLVFHCSLVYLLVARTPLSHSLPASSTSPLS